MISQAWLALAGFHWITGEITGCGHDPPMKNLRASAPGCPAAVWPSVTGTGDSTPAMARLERELGNDARKREHLLRADQFGGFQIGLAIGDGGFKAGGVEGETGAFAQLAKIEEPFGPGQFAEFRDVEPGHHARLHRKVDLAGQVRQRPWPRSGRAR
jgi:hypothetical protein